MIIDSALFHHQMVECRMELYIFMFDIYNDDNNMKLRVFKENFARS